MSNQPPNQHTMTQPVAIYLRVSTKKQGESGLGLEAQRRLVHQSGLTGVEFIEWESGKMRERPTLAEAIAYCRQHSAQLVVAKLDRLARDVAFTFELKNSGLDIRALDVPEFNTLTVGIIASFAQHERERIVERVKAAFQSKKARGDAEWRVGSMTEEKRQLAMAAKRIKATKNENNRRASALIVSMRKSGSSLRAIASELNKNGFATRKNRAFTAAQVQRLLARAEAC